MKTAADFAVVANEVARAQQEVEEIEAPGARLERLVRIAERPQLLAQAGREVGRTGVESAFQLDLRVVAQREDRRFFQLFREPPPPAAPVPQPSAQELLQLGFEPVEIAAAARRLAPPHFGHESVDLGDRFRRPIVRPLRPRRELADRGQLRQRALERRRAVERIPPPGAVEIAVLDQIAPGLPQQLARRHVAGPDLAPQEAPYAFGRIADDALEPGFERLVEEPLLLFTGRDREYRIDPRLDRPLAQQVGAERVDGPDRRDLEHAERARQPPLFLRGALGTRRLQLGPEPQLHFARSQIRECYREDTVEGRVAEADQRDDARHQLGGLARSGGSLDHQRAGEIAADSLARCRVGERRHGISRSLLSGTSASAGFFFVTRCHSPGPHTGW